MNDLGGDLWSTMARVGSCSYELAQLVLFVVVLISAFRIKRSIGTFLFAVSTLGSVVVSLAYDAMEAANAISFEASTWVYAFGGVVDIALAVLALVGIALIRPRATATTVDATTEVAS